VINDLLIMNRTADALRSLGEEVTLYDEASITPDSIRESVIFSMAQGPTGSATLSAIEKRGALVINSPGSVMNCYRMNMVTLLPKSGIPFPKSAVVATNSESRASDVGLMSKKVWVKRGDVHAVHKEDVTLANSPEEGLNLLKEFQRRGISQAIYQEHLQGDTVKFYAARETDLFHWYYSNGSDRTKFDERILRDLASASAESLGLIVYGGDAIIGMDGNISIIDVNDWPSFAPVREEASRSIAQILYRKGREYAHD
jgi:glutathione synthase/RimK-type ligase-like ATP-grasp enzyme